MGGVGSGDKLARGASKAQFPSPGGNVSQEKWDSIFGVSDEPKVSSGYANPETTRIPSPSPRKTKRNTRGK